MSANLCHPKSGLLPYLLLPRLPPKKIEHPLRLSQRVPSIHPITKDPQTRPRLPPHRPPPSAPSAASPGPRDSHHAAERRVQLGWSASRSPRTCEHVPRSLRTIAPPPCLFCTCSSESEVWCTSEWSFWEKMRHPVTSFLGGPLMEENFRRHEISESTTIDYSCIRL